MGVQEPPHFMQSVLVCPTFFGICHQIDKCLGILAALTNGIDSFGILETINRITSKDVLAWNPWFLMMSKNLVWSLGWILHLS